MASERLLADEPQPVVEEIRESNESGYTNANLLIREQINHSEVIAHNQHVPME